MHCPPWTWRNGIAGDQTMQAIRSLARATGAGNRGSPLPDDLARRPIHPDAGSCAHARSRRETRGDGDQQGPWRWVIVKAALGVMRTPLHCQRVYSALPSSSQRRQDTTSSIFATRIRPAVSPYRTRSISTRTHPHRSHELGVRPCEGAGGVG